MLHAKSEVTVIYSTNVVEAATKEAIHAKGRLTEIPAGAFENCNQVLKVTIPESVKAIGRSAFEGCSSLARITLSESVAVIRVGAFRGCNSLTNITLPESVTAIEGGAFEGCSSVAVLWEASISLGG